MVKTTCAVLSLGIFLIAPGFADNPLPASAIDLSGNTSLTEITGSLDDPNAVDMYKIYIANPLDFSAQTVQVPFGVSDTELFLFDSNGYGVYENDDATGINLLSCLPSADSGNPCSSSRNGLGPVTPGIYYLAITQSYNLPMSSSGYIFTFDTFSTDVLGPDITMGGGDPITGWDNDAFTNPYSNLTQYDIEITDSPATTATPEPATWPLLTAAVAAFAFFRPRQTR